MNVCIDNFLKPFINFSFIIKSVLETQTLVYAWVIPPYKTKVPHLGSNTPRSDD